MEVDWTSITIDNGQCEHPDCPWCAQRFFRWYKARMAQMHASIRGATTSFADAAATSNIPKEDR